MDKEVLVTSGLRAGRRLLDHLTAAGFEVSAAAWLRDPELDDWFLHLVSPDVKGLGEFRATADLHQHIRSLPQVELYPGMPAATFGPFDVRLLSEDMHLAKQILATYRAYPDARDRFVSGGRFDPRPYDPLVYLYGIPDPVPAG